jgi:hypothetical protein
MPIVYSTPKASARCPGDAITEEGHDKLKCYLYGQVVAKEMKEILRIHYHQNGSMKESSPSPG